MKTWANSSESDVVAAGVFITPSTRANMRHTLKKKNVTLSVSLLVVARSGESRSSTTAGVGASVGFCNASCSQYIVDPLRRVGEREREETARLPN